MSCFFAFQQFQTTHAPIAITSMGASPKPPEFNALGQWAWSRFEVSRHEILHAATPRQRPLWQRPPLRLPSGRAVS